MIAQTSLDMMRLPAAAGCLGIAKHALFDGVAGEMTATTPPLTTSGTLEGWFKWQNGVAVLRDSTTMAATSMEFDNHSK